MKIGEISVCMDTSIKHFSRWYKKNGCNPTKIALVGFIYAKTHSIDGWSNWIVSICLRFMFRINLTQSMLIETESRVCGTRGVMNAIHKNAITHACSYYNLSFSSGQCRVWRIVQFMLKISSFRLSLWTNACNWIWFGLFGVDLLVKMFYCMLWKSTINQLQSQKIILIATKFIDTKFEFLFDLS